MEKKVTVNIGLIFAYSFEIMIALLLLMMGYFHPAYLILYLLWILYQAYLKRQHVLYIIVLSLLLGGINSIKMPQFKEEVTGKVSYASTNGFIVNHTYYPYRFSKLNEGDKVYVKAIKDTTTTLKHNYSFNEANFIQGQGVYFIGRVESFKVISKETSITTKLQGYFGEQLGSYYAYLLFGKGDANNKLLRMLSKELMILHLFAISGMHFQILKQMMTRFLKSILPKAWIEWVVFVILGLYALLLGRNIGAWRSYLCMVLKKCTPLTHFQIFGCVGILFLMFEPKIFYHTSFIYSMCLYFLVLLVSHERQASLKIYGGACIVSMAMNYKIYPLGFIYGLFFQAIVEVFFPLFLINIVLKNALGPLLLYGLKGLEGVMSYLSQFELTLTIAKFPLIIYIALFVVYIYALYQSRFYHLKKWLLVILMVVSMVIYPRIDGKSYFEMIDVDQGDCFLISLDGRKENYLIDTGGLDYMDVATSRIIPFLNGLGITHLDAVFVSHSDFDHCGALESLKEHFKVKNVIETFDTFKTSRITIQNLNVPIHDNPNDNSQVLYTTIKGITFLLMGDASIEVENDLMKQYPHLTCDVLKIGHHGSHTSTSDAFLSHVNPKYALISCGLYNRFRHPSKRVMEALQAYGVEVLRSDYMGDVLLELKSSQLVLDL